MLWLIRLSGVFAAAMVTAVLSPSLQPLPAASFRPAPPIRNAHDCSPTPASSLCSPSSVHIAMTLDTEYMRGTMAAVHSVIRHANCPQSVFLHFLVTEPNLDRTVRAAFPQLNFKVYFFDPNRVKNLISISVRQALEQPLNYARNYLDEILEPCVTRVIYLDSDVIVVDDVAKLWRTELRRRVVGAPEYCHANFTKYFTDRFWSDRRLAGVFNRRRQPCYFNTGVMVMDLERWRKGRYTRRIERWMEVQKIGGRIYELGSLPPFLLVFAGRVAGIDHRWNQHGLGGDNVRGSCRDLHPGPVSLLHWSGSGKPWVRLDAGRACPLDALWAPYDLAR